MEIFSVDLGNKQTKLRSSKNTIVLPSRYLNANDMPEMVGSTGADMNIHQFKVPFADDEYIAGKDVNDLHLDDFIQDTLMFGNRYNTEAFKLLSNFSLGLLARDFSKARNGILDVVLVAGLPTGDYGVDEQRESLKSVLGGQHMIDVDGETFTVRVKKLYILPQPVGTLYSELLDDESYIKNEDLLNEMVGIVDVGGGTILIDTILNFQLSRGNRHQYETGINSLYESVQNDMHDGSNASIFQLEKVIREGLPTGTYVYRFSKNNTEDISDNVETNINRFTRRVIANVNSTLKNLDKIDTLLFTGGGSAILNSKLINQAFTNAIIVKDAETANVDGFYKFGLSEQLKKDGSDKDAEKAK